MDAYPITPEVAMLEQYLKDRAIPTDPDFLKAAGFSYVAGNEITTLLSCPYPPHQLGIKMSYPGTDYTTVRLVGEPTSGPRCPKDRIPCAYFPHLVDWNKLDDTLVICESPIKAITWAMMGYHAIAAGGVTTVWMGRKQLWCEGFPHEAIEDGTIKTVLIAWDSDTEGSNRSVAGAVRSLCRALRQRHHSLEVLVHVLPQPPAEYDDHKWGCDDMHAFIGSEMFREFCADESVRRLPDADKLQQHLDELNEQYVVCHETTKVHALRTGNDFTGTEFANMVECSRKIMIDTDKGPKPLKVASHWMEHPDRHTVEYVRYEPGQEITGDDFLNIWKDDGVTPQQGDVSPWLSLINDSIRDPMIRTLMVQCMAFQVQNRGKRLEKLLYFVGRDQGTGKSTMANIMGQVLGSSNVGRPTKKSIEGDFNEGWLQRELCVMDDIQKLKPDVWSLLKTLITSDEVENTQKFALAKTRNNYCVFYITSNQSDIITTDMDERRVLMIPFEPATLHREGADTYWKEFHAWKEDGGIAHIAHYLLHYDLSDFDPGFHPPLTSAKLAAQEASLSDEEVFLQAVSHDPYSYLPEGRVVVTGHELFTMHTGEEPNSMNKRELIRFTKLLNSKLLLRKARPKQLLVWQVDKMSGTKKKVGYSLFWVPGCQPDNDEYISSDDARENLKSFDIVL